MKTRAITIVSLTALALSGCGMKSESLQAYRSEQTPYIHEAAYVYLFRSASSRGDSLVSVYCLASGLGDERRSANPDLVRAFANDSLPVRNLSDCAISEDFQRLVVDNETGQQAILLGVGDPVWLDDKSVRVEAEYVLSALGSAYFDCLVERQGVPWRVSHCGKLLVSPVSESP